MFGSGKPRCPFCGSDRFIDFRNRKDELCAGCRSKVRTRAAYLVLTEHCRVGSGSRIAHFAPEGLIADKLFALCGSNYRAFDLDPPRYADRMEAPVERCDLCADLPSFEQDSFDVVIHNHVLEHVPCNYTIVLQRLHGLLKPGGVHVFSFPVQNGYFREDQSREMAREDRERRFGQWDHLRRFGSKDLDLTIGAVFAATKNYKLTDVITEAALLGAAVPPSRWLPENGTIFAVRKD